MIRHLMSLKNIKLFWVLIHTGSTVQVQTFTCSHSNLLISGAEGRTKSFSLIRHKAFI